MGKNLKFIITMSLCLFLAGCGNDREYLESEMEYLESEISALETEIAQLETEIAQKKSELNLLEGEIVDKKIENGTAKYIVTFNIKQSHFTLDISQHIKDEMNDISIQIPVDKEYYDNVEVGDVIADDFRMGSLIMKGSFGNWNVIVEDKTIQ